MILRWNKLQNPKKTFYTVSGYLKDQKEYEKLKFVNDYFNNNYDHYEMAWLFRYNQLLRF